MVVSLAYHVDCDHCGGHGTHDNIGPVIISATGEPGWEKSIAAWRAFVDEPTELLRRALVVVRYVDERGAVSSALHFSESVDVHELRELIERYLERIDSERDR